ncbi:hypothetical protein [Winogradskyella helgolandensis]|uniref:hypothetical protein n=1 Tax=Winogradskyella helgolandensis TaxID=2697010 RepID=UPI0015C9CCBD|nr:hypothetical protein [Winogradskyella helgolandensis]
MNNLLEQLSPRKKLTIGIIAAIVALILLYIMNENESGFLVGAICGIFTAMAFFFLVTYKNNSN